MKNHELLSDLIHDDMIYAICIRSDVSRGELLELSCPRLPNSYYLIRAEDIPFKNDLAGFNHPVLAEKDILYNGQIIAVLAGPNESFLKRIKNEIKINIREEKAFHSMEELDAEDVRNIIAAREISSENNLEKNIDQINDNYFTSEYITGIQDHFYPESCGAMAYNENDNLIIHTDSQWPYHVKKSIINMLGINSKNIIVKPTSSQMHMDGKLWYPSLLSCLAALAAFNTGRPVKLMPEREDDFMFSPKRNESLIKITCFLDDNNNQVSREIDVKINLGSFGILENEIIDQTCMGSLGIYSSGEYKIKAKALRTNLPVQGPMCGFGMSQGFFASELFASNIADKLSMDPARWRKENFIYKNYPAIDSVNKNRVFLPELIDKAAEMSDYYRKWAAYELLRKRRREEIQKKSPESSSSIINTEKLRGIAITTCFQGNGFLNNEDMGYAACSVELTLEKDSSLIIKSSLSSLSRSSRETWMQIAHDILGVNPEFIEFYCNSDIAPDSGAGTLSRNIVQLRGLIEQCCNAIRSQRFRDPLPITVKRSIKQQKAAGWSREKINLDAFSNPAWAAAALEVEIDPVSYIPSIRGIWLIAECGKVISLKNASISLETGIINALGWTIGENLNYSNGRIPPEIIRSYYLSSPSAIPPITVDFFPNDSSPPKGIGDLAFNCIPSAYVQSLSQAMDYQFTKIPVSIQDIWEAAKNKNRDLES